MMIRVRIAPSPTGFAHLGTAYIALFNYAFARHEGGVFILRLEDTDIKREVKGAEEAIYTNLSWLGLSWDEGPDVGGDYGPYRQSEKLEVYKNKANELLEKGLAYEEDGAIRFKNPGEDITWNDLVRGEVAFGGGEVTDFVLLKSDGFPTYHFAVVVDDIEMKISHVLRGEDHISNTPKHIALYKAFGAEIPLFGHLPTLRNSETKKKLSKRRDKVDIGAFRDEGYLPQSLLNFLMLLGWSHPEGKEIFSLEEFVNKFDVSRIQKAGPIFDITKLDWLNGEYIRQLPVNELISKLEDLSPSFKTAEDSKKNAIVGLIQERIKKLTEINTFAGFFFKKPKVDKSMLGKNYESHIKVATEVIKTLGDWNIENMNEKLIAEVKNNNFKTGDFFMDLRIAIAGSRFTPPINESMIILGREETLARLALYS